MKEQWHIFLGCYNFLRGIMALNLEGWIRRMENSLEKSFFSLDANPSIACTDQWNPLHISNYAKQLVFINSLPNLISKHQSVSLLDEWSKKIILKAKLQTQIWLAHLLTSAHHLLSFSPKTSYHSWYLIRFHAWPFALQSANHRMRLILYFVRSN